MQRFRAVPLLLAATAIIAAGCDDATTAPTALLVGGEAKAALHVAQRLPTLPGLSTRVLVQQAATGHNAMSLLEARSLWLDAEAAAPEDAERLRNAAYDIAIPELTRGLTQGDVMAVQDSMRQWIRIASTAAGVGDVAGIAAALDHARVLLDDGARAEPLDHRRAVELTLRASDELLSTTPRAVAHRLVVESERRWKEYGANRERTADHRRLDRVDRLVRGAREALAQEDYLLAIRRAFYAGQLMEGR